MDSASAKVHSSLGRKNAPRVSRREGSLSLRLVIWNLPNVSLRCLIYWVESGFAVGYDICPADNVAIGVLDNSGASMPHFAKAIFIGVPP